MKKALVKDKYYATKFGKMKPELMILQDDLYYNFDKEEFGFKSSLDNWIGDRVVRVIMLYTNKESDEIPSGKVEIWW